MSVIAWDGKTVAADKQGTLQGLKLTVTKAIKIDTQEILAWTGSHDKGLMLADWYKRGADPDKYPEFQQTDDWCRLIVVSKTGAKSYEQYPIPIIDEELKQAWGSGRDFAYGAMEMGASAITAVQIATKFDNSCGMGVDYYVVNE